MAYGLTNNPLIYQKDRTTVLIARTYIRMYLFQTVDKPVVRLLIFLQPAIALSAPFLAPL